MRLRLRMSELRLRPFQDGGRRAVKRCWFWRTINGSICSVKRAFFRKRKHM